MAQQKAPNEGALNLRHDSHRIFEQRLPNSILEVNDFLVDRLRDAAQQVIVAKNKSRRGQVVSWVVTVCRILVGILVIKTGFDLASGAGSSLFTQSDSIMTGIFVMIIGIYFVFSSVVRQFSGDE